MKLIEKLSLLGVGIAFLGIGFSIRKAKPTAANWKAFIIAGVFFILVWILVCLGIVDF